MKSEATPQEWERRGDGGVTWEGKREEGRGGERRKDDEGDEDHGVRSKGRC